MVFGFRRVGDFGFRVWGGVLVYRIKDLASVLLILNILHDLNIL